MKALVTGGTGTLGRLVVPRLQDAGYDVRVLSRHSHDGLEGFEFVTGDLATGEGIDAAVEGTEIIVHLAGDKKGDEHKAQNLVRAASRNGTQHLVYISVVGADRIPVTSRIDRTMFGYFASKLAAEQIVADSGLPWTTLRATQFHQSMLLLVQQMAKLPVIPVPARWRFQPVDAVEVADRLAELATDYAVRTDARDRRPARVRDDRAGPYLPARPRQTPADPACLDPRQGGPSLSVWRQPCPGSGSGRPHVGGNPGSPDEFLCG